MSATTEQFRELLDTEDVVHMGKLSDIARHGIPAKVRGEVWKYLLGVKKPDKSEEMMHEREQTYEYNELEKSASVDVTRNIKQSIVRLYGKYNIFAQESVQNKMVNIISVYTNHNTEVSYNSGMLSILAPFIFSLKSEVEIYWCFEAVMKKIEQHFQEESITNKLSRFMMYLRSVHPALFTHFEEEELIPNEWAMPWLQYLLARQLPLECVLRLWDTYFAVNDGLELHVYVCIAILVNCSEDLMELEISELKAYLHKLPLMDMDEIISHAYNIRDEIKSSNL